MDTTLLTIGQLLAAINGWGSFPGMTPAFEWTIAALRAHPAPLT